MNLKRNLKKGLAVVFSAMMMTSGMNIPIVAEDTVKDDPSQMHIVYGLGEGKITVTQNGETTELTSGASGEQQVFTVQGNENEPVEITVEAGTDFNVERFSEYIYGAEADEITTYVSEPTKTVSQTINISMGKIVEIAFTDPVMRNEVMPLGPACSMGQYQSHGFAGLADFAMTQIGTPYATGGTGFGLYDCCGLVSRAFWAIGWTGYENPPGFHNTNGWHNILQAVGFEYSDIDLAQGFNPAAYPTQRGDIAIFYNEHGIAGPNAVHAAIMLDNNNMVGALYQGVTNQIPVSNWYTQSGLGAKDSRYVRIYHLSYQPEIPTTVTVTKTSTKADVTNGNSLYSMEGAEYTIYRDQACTQALTTVTIGADGRGTSGEFTLDTPNATTLYAKETKAPNNGSYKLNQSVISFTVQNGSGSFTAQDEPINDPLMIQISKLSEDNEIIDNPSSLEGAEFTVKYYTGEYNTLEELAGVEPTKTWVLGTKKLGSVYAALLSDEYKVGGDDFYYSSNGTPVLYLGTLTIEETKAPVGYTKEGALSFKVNNETQEAELIDGVALFKLLNENSQVAFKTANGLSIDNAELIKEERSIRGGFSLNKTDSQTDTQWQGDATNLQATFTLHNDNNFDAVMRDSDGTVLGSAEAGQDFNYKITTDASGNWTSPAGFLPVGKYTLRESSAPNGYNLTNTTYQFEITETNTNINIDHVFKNDIIRGGFKLQKNDTVLGTTPQGNANLKIEFEVYSNSNSPVVVNGVTYHKGDLVWSGTTNDQGYYESPANLLPYGTYTLKEKAAPTGYQYEGSLQTVFEIRQNGTLVDLTTGQISDEVTRGGFKVQKNDTDLDAEAQGSANLSMEFEVVNNSTNPVVVNGQTYAKGEVVFTGTTNEQGVYESASDLLPYGDYILNETKAPVGYTDRGNKSVEFTVSEEAVIIDLTDDITNEVIRGGFRVQKKDKETATRPQGDTDFAMTFEVVTNNEHPVVVNGETYEKGDVVYTNSTNAEGIFESVNDLLPYGNYTLNEVKPPVGYTTDGNLSVTFDISEDTAIIDLTNVINNRVVLGGLNLHKVFTDVEGTNWTENESGAVFAVVRDTYVEQYGSVAEAIAHQYGVTTAEVTNRDWLYENLFVDSDTADTLNKDGSNADLMTGHEYAVIRTNADGNATTGEKVLAYGNYTVAQLASGEDEITVTDQKYNVTINGDGTMLQLQASNIPQTYFIRMVKRDADTGELSTFNSAEFKIFQLEDVRGEEVNEYVTMKVGSVVYDTFRTTSDNGSNDLPSGTFYAVGESAGTVTTPLKLESGLYRIEEVATPDGFVTSEPIEQVVRLANISETDEEDNNFITVTIADPRAYGELVINKSIVDTAADTDLIPADVLSKIEFTLTAAEDIINPDDGTVLTKKGEVAKDILGNTVGKFNLNAEGKATVSKIALGKYLLTETFIPDELAVNTETWNVDFIQTEGDVTTQVYNVTLDIENKPTYIELSKKAVTGDDELPGAHIQVIEKDTGIVVDEYTSTETPHSIKGLKRDTTYIMRETITPNEGEYIKATDIEFTVNADGSVKTVTMIDKLVTLRKSDVNDNLAAGAEITITGTNGETVDVITTDGENTFHIYNLTAGETYKVSETVVPEGYVKFNDFTFTVLDDGKDQTLEIVNKRVSATKINTAGEAISGAEMNVTDVNGNIIDSWTTDGTDHYINGLVEENDYVLNEVKAANGYVIATSIPFTVTGADDQNIKVDQNVTMTDKTVEIQKVDMCGVNVDGAQLTVYELDENGNVITETVMDEAGNPVEQPKVVDQWTTVLGMHHYANNLIAGHTYKVVETFVPEGYTKAPDYVFTVADDGKDQTETIVNKQVLISKETVGGEPVEGAILTIIDKETGEVVDRFVTEKTKHESNNLEVGKTYILHEDTTPAGFVTATDVEFTVTEDGVDQTVTMVDAVEEVAKVDQNGDLLKGASLELVNEQGEVIDSWISGRHVIDLTEEQITDLESGKFVETVMEDGRTAEIIVTDKNVTSTPDEKPEETDDPEAGDDKEDVCEIKYAEPAEELTEIEVTEDSDLAFTLVITNEDGSKEYINIDLNGDETTHRLNNTVAGTKYTVREVDEVDGYYFAENQEVNVTGTEDHTTTMIDNIINYRINKVDEDGNNIAGVLMSMKDITDPENPVDVELPNGGVTTELGFDLTGILIAGHRYEITEERTVPGYSMPQVSTMEFVVPTHGSAEWTVLNFENLSNAIAVSKVDNAGKPLAGARMQIIEATVAEDGTITEGDVVYEFTTTDTPTDISDYVKGGDGTQYILREVESPFGYEVIEDMLFTVDMAKPGTAQLLTAVDSLEHVFIKAVKVDAADHNKVLEGAELTLFTADGEIAKTVDGKDAVAVTDENGEIYWEVEYAEGMYVQETKAPEGYKLNSNFHEVKIGEDYTFVENEPIEIMVADEANPKTGITSGIGGMIAMAGMAGALGVLLYSMRKKEKTSEAE